MPNTYAAEIAWSRNLPEMGTLHHRFSSKLSDIDERIAAAQQMIDTLRAEATKQVEQHNFEVRCMWTDKEIDQAIKQHLEGERHDDKKDANEAGQSPA